MDGFKITQPFDALVCFKQLPLMPSQSLTVRPISCDDLPLIIQLEQASSSKPWSSQQITDCINGDYCVEVFEGEISDNRIIGYWILQSIVDELHLLNITIAHDAQGKGFGKSAMARLLDRARELQANTLYLEVRKSNQIARSVYTQAGFSVIGQRKDYYSLTDGGREDAILMKCVITP